MAEIGLIKLKKGIEIMERYTYDYGPYGLEERKVRRNFLDMPYMTIALIFINVAIFLVMEIIGDTEETQFLYEHGGMYWPAVSENGEWYRIFTHMFMHSGFDHLLNNMLMLGVLGYHIEKEFGSIKFLISYIICGVAGTLVSSLYETLFSEYAVGIGASGAIMGIFGIFLAMQFIYGKRRGQLAFPRLAIIFVLMVFGNMQEGVDWMAHFGGAVAGIILGILLYRPSK